jgi:hypothetical protein
MSNAAIYFHPESFDTDVRRLIAGSARGCFLKGFVRHADLDRFQFLERRRQAQGRARSAFALPTWEEAEQVYRYISRQASTRVEEVMAETPEPQKLAVERGTEWLMKFGALRVADDEAAP